MLEVSYAWYHCRIRPLPQWPRLAAGPGPGTGRRAAGGGGPELRAHPAGRGAPAARACPGAGGAGLRGRPRLCPARPLRLRRGRGLCPGRGLSFGRCRVQRAGLRGRDAGRRAAAAGRPGTGGGGLPRRPQSRPCRRGPELCRRPAGRCGSRSPGHRAGGAAGQAQQQPRHRILQGHPAAGRCDDAHSPAPPGREPRRNTERQRPVCQRQCAAGPLGRGRRSGHPALCARGRLSALRGGRRGRGFC